MSPNTGRQSIVSWSFRRGYNNREIIRTTPVLMVKCFFYLTYLNLTECCSLEALHVNRNIWASFLMRSEQLLYKLRVKVPIKVYIIPKQKMADLDSGEILKFIGFSTFLEMYVMLAGYLVRYYPFFMDMIATLVSDDHYSI